MNNIKYIMLPRIEEKQKDIKPQPWYKERLRDKYITKNPNKEKLLDAKQWVFIKDGLDDFRDGLPPPSNDVFIKPSKGPGPLIKNDTWKFKETVLSPARRLNLNQRCYSKKLPLAQAKRDNIEQIIAGLTQHPLALYSHLEEAVPVDLFEEILDILDPEINEQLLNEASEESSEKKSQRSRSATNRSRSRETRGTYVDRNIKEELQRLEEELKKEYEENRGKRDTRAVRNTYKWLLKKEELKARAKGPDVEQQKAEAIDNHIKHVTEEYCDWVKSLGGEHNIDPTTVGSLFASGYDTKPPLSVPIQVVELTNIPAELRSTAYAPDMSSRKEKLEKNIYRDEEAGKKETHYRYGAWYLDKKLWRLMPTTEKLIDPKIIKEAEKKDSNKKAEEINSKLAPLYGAKAFKEYVINSQPKRVPKLIDELDEWQNDQTTKKTARSISAAQLSYPLTD